MSLELCVPVSCTDLSEAVEQHWYVHTVHSGWGGFYNSCVGADGVLSSLTTGGHALAWLGLSLL